MTHGEFSALLGALVARKRLDGTECREQGHDFGERAQATAWEIGDRLVLTVGAVCRVCEKPVTVNESLPMLADPALEERAQREALKDLKKRMLAQDRKHREGACRNPRG